MKLEIKGEVIIAKSQTVNSEIEIDVEDLISYCNEEPILDRNELRFMIYDYISDGNYVYDAIYNVTYDENCVGYEIMDNEILDIDKLIDLVESKIKYTNE